MPSPPPAPLLLALLGAELIAKSPGDGYSIMIHSASFTTSVAVQPKLSFDPVKDFTPITPDRKSTRLNSSH